MQQGSSFTRSLGLIPSSVMIGIFFFVPFVLILMTSVSVPSETGDYQLGFSMEHFERFATWFYIERALFSAGLCALIALLSLLIAYPFTYMLTQFGPRSQTLWLIYILAQLSLSEVLIAFSWQILLSRTGGIANILVMVGLAEKSFAMTPSAGAVLAALVYLAVPFSVLLLYPALSRLDKSLIEASRTLGASPLRTFFTVVMPVTRPAIISSGVTIFVLTLGAIIVPQVLGKPEHWTLSVLITDQAIFNFNMPFASALAVVLLALSASVIAVVTKFSGGK
ncbi:ABC transporter permease [Pseudohalocynthiibacter aestuariivivens]|uniref:ABC transporter permease n=1 Tax=Roseovarius pelagicus TaxID=2980108 RepID=A0ABY6DCU0_9RHOB|nr:MULTISPECIES: ABC transporter permease [Rhodobacterales]QIE44261.1 ABC transporter permease [Pseudohalocynthiibacter aestuariivivens]UXX83839.1 ABC transporter permease [Roseovarius pelagicus]